MLAPDGRIVGVWTDLLALGWEGEMKGSVAKFGLEHILQQYSSIKNPRSKLRGFGGARSEQA